MGQSRFFKICPASRGVLRKSQFWERMLKNDIFNQVSLLKKYIDKEKVKSWASGSNHNREQMVRNIYHLEINCNRIVAKLYPKSFEIFYVYSFIINQISLAICRPCWFKFKNRHRFSSNTWGITILHWIFDVFWFPPQGSWSLSRKI